MFKLKVVRGPQKGKSYRLREGENTIGRVPNNVIVLQSSQVSKEHCNVVVEGSTLKLLDETSTNGTFVNGNLATDMELRLGDRIAVGDFTFEVRQSRSGSKGSSRSEGFANVPMNDPNVLPFPGVDQFPVPVDPSSLPAGSSPQSAPAAHYDSNDGDVMPNDLRGKIFWHFEHYVMPFFYGLNIKYDWKYIAIWLFGVFLVLNLIVSIYPATQTTRAMIVAEAGRRARTIAKQIIEDNEVAIAGGEETKAFISDSIDADNTVPLAILTDLDNRIIAPSTKLNQYFTLGQEATYASKVGQAFREGREFGVINELNQSTVIAIEPLKILDPKVGRNVAIAMAVVTINTSLITPDVGVMGLTYSKTLIFTALLCAFILMIMYRLTLKPFEVLNSDVDKVLRGELGDISRDFRNEDLAQLWDVLSSALERIPKEEMLGGGSNQNVGGSTEVLDGVASAMNLLGETSDVGYVICDLNRNVKSLNAKFEDITGIRETEAAGQALSSMARDQAFGSLVDDMFTQADSSVSDEPITEEFDFSGVTYRMQTTRVGGMSPAGYILCVYPTENDY